MQDSGNSNFVSGPARISYLELFTIEFSIMVLYSLATFLSFAFTSSFFSDIDRFVRAGNLLIEGSPLTVFFSGFLVLLIIVGALSLFNKAAPNFIGVIRSNLIWEIPRLFSMVACVMTGFFFALAVLVYRHPDAIGYDSFFFLMEGTKIFIGYLILSCFLAKFCKGDSHLTGKFFR